MAAIVDVVIIRPCLSMDAALIVDPLRMLNQLAGKTLAEIRTSTTDGKPVELLNGPTIVPTCCLADVQDPRIVVIVCSRQATANERRLVRPWLRRNGNAGVRFYAATCAPFLLAEAGLLTGHEAAVHWEVIPALSEQYPDVKTLEQICVVDRNITTCAGHCAIADMMVQLVQIEFGECFAQALAEELMIPISRLRGTPQRPPCASLDGRLIDARIGEALRIMRERLEDPVSVKALAHRVGLSIRQFEKLFARSLGRSPTSRYVDLRLERGRELLCYTDLGIREVSIACGFSSLAIFCRAFKKRTGQTASGVRKTYRASFDRARISVLGTNTQNSRGRPTLSAGGPNGRKPPAHTPSTVF
jgi:transcriptional regulator GlxA family with amidase domain